MTTREIQPLVLLARAGDLAAREQLGRAILVRLEQLARQMLKRFPAVRFHEQTGDVLQNAILRFFKALDSAEINDSRHFIALASRQIRLELLDLARKYRGQRGRAGLSLDAAEATVDAPGDDLDEWCAFHEAVAQLPDDEREVFEPIFYQDASQRDLAEQLGTHAKTIQRRYRRACVRLYEQLAGKLPTP